MPFLSMQWSQGVPTTGHTRLPLLPVALWTRPPSSPTLSFSIHLGPLGSPSTLTSSAMDMVIQCNAVDIGKTLLWRFPWGPGLPEFRSCWGKDPGTHARPLGRPAFPHGRFQENKCPENPRQASFILSLKALRGEKWPSIKSFNKNLPVF